MERLESQLVLDENIKHEPKEDLIRIQKALFVHRDIYCTLDECGHIWQNYSWSLSASWLDIPTDLVKIIGRMESAYNFKSYREWITS